MTVGEGVRAYKAYEERRKDAAFFAYTNAMTTGLFIASMFGSKSPPTIHEVYPEFFKQDEETEEIKQEIRDAKSEVNFLNFAKAFNRNFDNGSDRTTQSESDSRRESSEG